MKIVVGSTNPVKTDAVKQAAASFYTQTTIEIKGVRVGSGVAEQPLSDKEMITGAKNRAQAALKAEPEADLAVGLEGGLHKIDGVWYGRSWMAVTDRSGRFGVGASASVAVPERMMELVHAGKDMKEVCEILYGIRDIGKKAGYFGLLTNDLITRTSGYKDGVIMALAAFNHQS